MVSQYKISFINFSMLPLKWGLAVLLVWIVCTVSSAQVIRTKEELETANKRLAKLGSSAKRVDLLVDMGLYFLNLRGETKEDLGTALSFQKQAHALGNRISYHKGVARSMVLEGNILREGAQKKEAEQAYDKAMVYADKFQLTNELADVYGSKAQLFSNEGAELGQKIKLDEKALALYRSASNKMQEADYLKNLGDLYLLKGDTKYALKLLDTALIVYKSIGFKELQGVYNIMCITYSELADYSKALHYGLLAEKTADLMNDHSLQRSSIDNHLALVYYYNRQDPEALQYWSAAKTIAEKYGDAGYIQTIMANMAAVLVRMKRHQEGIAILKEMAKKYPPADVQMKVRIPYLLFNTYYDIKEYAKAEPYYDQLLKFHQQLSKDDVNQSFLYRSIIRKLMHDKNYLAVQEYLAAHNEQSKLQGNILMQAQLHRQWFDVDSALGKPWEAIVHYKLFKTLKDSVFNIEKSRQIAGMEIEYQTAKKDKDILLLQQKSKLQQTMLHQGVIIRYVFVGGLVLAILFIALIYSRSRLKTRSNLIMERKQEEINAQNDQLKKLLGEKEWLLREIHHRVKNNLQIVISLLNTQSAYLDNEDALVAIRNSQNRMHAMSLIHQKLYQSDNLAEIDMNWYIKELVDYMRECFGTDKKIVFKVETEVIKLDVAQAVPLGLILNEAISNAIKYAFPGDLKGHVNVSFRMMPGNLCALRISDNGIGLPEGFEPGSTSSLGMSLMMGLSDQLNGHFNLWNAEGLTLEVSFTRHHELLEHTEMIALAN